MNKELASLGVEALENVCEKYLGTYSKGRERGVLTFLLWCCSKVVAMVLRTIATQREKRPSNAL